jgi:uncharacterized protein
LGDARPALMRADSIISSDDGPCSELELLEQAATGHEMTEYHANRHGLVVAPIPSAWVLEGAPIARNKLLSRSRDGMASTYMWDSTAGRFNWLYEVDETIWLIEGCVTVTDSAGACCHLKAGDAFFFPCGSRFEWNVTKYVRKVAFLHVPLSRKMLLLKRLFAIPARLRTARARQKHAASHLGSGSAR